MSLLLKYSKYRYACACRVVRTTLRKRLVGNGPRVTTCHACRAGQAETDADDGETYRVRRQRIINNVFSQLFSYGRLYTLIAASRRGPCSNQPRTNVVFLKVMATTGHYRRLSSTALKCAKVPIRAYRLARVQLLFALRVTRTPMHTECFAVLKSSKSRRVKNSRVRKRV